MKNCFGNIVLCLASLLVSTAAADASNAPGTVKELWAESDAHQDALDAKRVREWEQDNIVYGYHHQTALGG